MKLRERQATSLFRQHGIRLPAGVATIAADNVDSVIASLQSGCTNGVQKPASALPRQRMAHDRAIIGGRANRMDDDDEESAARDEVTLPGLSASHAQFYMNQQSGGLRV